MYKVALPLLLSLYALPALAQSNPTAINPKVYATTAAMVVAEHPVQSKPRPNHGEVRTHDDTAPANAPWRNGINPINHDQEYGADGKPIRTQ